MGTEQITIRAANISEAPLILEFIRKKAAFDASMACTGTLQTSEEAIRETLFGATPFAHVILAEVNSSPAAFALYYFRYSSFKGRPHLWLDDLYVNEEVRSKGTGLALMRRLAQIAVAHQSTHMAWTASSNNTRGVQFYERLGAKITEQRGNCLCFQSDAQVIHNLAQQL